MLTIQEIILIFALIGVLGGWALGRLGSRWASREANRPGDSDHRIRALEAELRVAQRKAEETELTLERNREEIEAVRAEARAAADSCAERDGELQALRKRLADECAKTQTLRVELTERAEETIRASVRVKEAETELSVARAGSDAVLEEIRRLAAEREELTDRLRVLQAESNPRAGATVTRLHRRDPTER
jgi:chromosome segregation ATPase